MRRSGIVREAAEDLFPADLVLGEVQAPLVLLEYHLAPGLEEGAGAPDLVRIGADGNPHWLRIWPQRRIPVTPGSNCG